MEILPNHEVISLGWCILGCIPFILGLLIITSGKK